VFGGTATVTWAASSSGGTAVARRAAARAATAVERTSWASVSRFTAPWVRPPVALTSCLIG